MTREQKIINVINLHEKMKGAYFYKSPGNASSRRYYEKQNSLITKFSYKKQKIEIKQETTCSCKNVYYKMTIYIEGEKTNKNIKFLKSLLNKKMIKGGILK